MVMGFEVVLRTSDGKRRRFGTEWCRKFQVCDLAASEATAADYTVIAEFWATPEGDLLVRAVARGRVAVPDQPAFFSAHHAGCPVKVESIGYQAGMIQTMLRAGFPAEPVYPDADKLTRAGSRGSSTAPARSTTSPAPIGSPTSSPSSSPSPPASTTTRSTRSPTRRGRCASTACDLGRSRCSPPAQPRSEVSDRHVGSVAFG